MHQIFRVESQSSLCNDPCVDVVICAEGAHLCLKESRRGKSKILEDWRYCEILWDIVRAHLHIRVFVVRFTFLHSHNACRINSYTPREIPKNECCEHLREGTAEYFYLLKSITVNMNFNFHAAFRYFSTLAVMLLCSMLNRVIAGFSRSRLYSVWVSEVWCRPEENEDVLH